MIDLKKLRNDLDSVAERLKSRGFTLDVDQIKGLESQRRASLQKLEALQMRRNQLAREIAKGKKAGEDCQTLLDEAAQVSADTKAAEQVSRDCDHTLSTMLALVPNMPHESVPIGQDESDNVVVRVVGEPPVFSFPVQDHEALCASTNAIDVQKAAQLSGSRFMILKGAVSKLHRALSQWMLDVHTQEHDYVEYNVPVLANPVSLYGTGQLPKFHDDLFVTNDDRELMLIPTAEVQLVNLLADEIVAQDTLPMAFCSHSLCFRKEAGSYGKDTKGIFRMHQFEKVELVRFVEPEHSYRELEAITKHAENILKQLKLPYRVVSLCTGDMGFASTKTYDIEVWIPSQNTYREISSCSNTEDFQTRRIKARYRDASKKTQFLHALNGSGVAVGRLLIALLENGQQEDGSIALPEVIQPYMNGLTHIRFD